MLDRYHNVIKAAIEQLETAQDLIEETSINLQYHNYHPCDLNRATKIVDLETQRLQSHFKDLIREKLEPLKNLPEYES